MICAHTVRKVKPGQARAFIDAFTPSGEQVHPGSGWVRFFALQGQGDPDTVVTFGFFEGTRDEMEASQGDQGFDEHRRAAEQQFADHVISNDVYDVVVHMKVDEPAATTA
jgi:heme-degrading monooxygenase HmoA